MAFDGWKLAEAMKNLVLNKKPPDHTILMSSKTHQILKQRGRPKSIQCLTCRKISYNSNDIKEGYLANCNCFHIKNVKVVVKVVPWSAAQAAMRRLRGEDDADS